MRFQFCGNLSIAEWFLAESSILTKIIIVQHLLKHQIEGIDNSDKVYSTLENSGFTKEESSAMLACLDYIISNSIRYEITDTALLKDLIDLGLPKENCESITKVYKEYSEKLKEKKRGEILKISSVNAFDFSVSEILASKKLRNPEYFDTTHADIALKVSNFPSEKKENSENIRFSVTREKALELIFEMKRAQEVMEKINN